MHLLITAVSLEDDGPQIVLCGHKFGPASRRATVELEGGGDQVELDVGRRDVWATNAHIADP